MPKKIQSTEKKSSKSEQNDTTYSVKTDLDTYVQDKNFSQPEVMKKVFSTYDDARNEIKLFESIKSSDSDTYYKLRNYYVSVATLMIYIEADLKFLLKKISTTYKHDLDNDSKDNIEPDESSNEDDNDVDVEDNNSDNESNNEDNSDSEKSEVEVVQPQKSTKSKKPIKSGKNKVEATEDTVEEKPAKKTKGNKKKSEPVEESVDEPAEEKPVKKTKGNKKKSEPVEDAVVEKPSKTKGCKKPKK